MVLNVSLWVFTCLTHTLNECSVLPSVHLTAAIPLPATRRCKPVRTSRDRWHAYGSIS